MAKDRPEAFGYRCPAVLGPLLDLVEVAMVRDQRIVGRLAYPGWIVFFRQATHVDFLDPTFSARLVLVFRRLRRPIR